MVNWKRVKDIVCSLVFMGSLWQLEIAKLNMLHGWSFGYLFGLLYPVNNWAASDFFMLLMVASFVGVALNGE
jgi:hypothetical protein